MTDQRILDALKPAVERYSHFGRDTYINDAMVIFAKMQQDGISRSSCFFDAVVVTNGPKTLPEWLDALNESWPEPVRAKRRAGDFNRFDSGELGNPRYQIDSLIPGQGAMVRIQLREQEARDFVCWHQPDDCEYDLNDTDDSDAFLDMLIEAVHAWVATFPLHEVRGGEHNV